MTDLFLSYKAEDRGRVAPLVQALEQDGFNVWWDAHIGGGEDWRETILRHLESARCVIVAWSKRSVGPHGSFVRDEATRALRRGTYLPVRIDRIDPPLGFGETQALDLLGWKGDRTNAQYCAILDAVRRRLSIDDGNSHAAHPGPALSRRKVLIGVGTMGALSAFGLGALLYRGSTATAGDSIAVLPFENLSGDPQQAYFSDGIAEELRSALSRIAGLSVVARTSSEAVRDDDAKTAARKLGVTDILTGSVRRSTRMIRISAQLIDGKRGLERWSDVYDRPPGDTLQIQTDIADKVANALSIRLGTADQKRIEEGGTNNPQAHDLVLQGQSVFQAPETAERVGRALGMADAAIELDPKYAGAWALKAGLEMLLAGVFANSAAEAHAKYAAANQSARQAIHLAPNSRLGYVVLASILDQQLQRRAARMVFLKMQYLPGTAGEESYAMQLSETAQHSEALRLIEHALNADPLNARTRYFKASILANARRYEDALAEARELANVGPERAPPHAFMAYYLMLLGRYSEAEAEFAKASGARNFALGWESILAFKQGNIPKSDELLGQLKSTSGDAAYFQIAEVLAQQGKRDAAIAALESAMVSRDPGLTGILVDPLLDPLRSDPRFEAIIKKLDFPA